MAEAERQLRLVRFDTFEVDLESGELRKAGTKLKFGGQPFQVLAILLENPGVVVTRDELQKRLWPATFVDVDHNLNTAINRIREVLGDSAESPRYVETLPRRGYRFVAPVERDGSEDAANKREKDVAPSPRFGGSVPFILIGSTLLVVAVAFLGWRIAIRRAMHSGRQQSSVSRAGSSKMRIVPLTSLPGMVSGPAFSPDGERIAYFWNGANPFKSDLYVQLIGGEKPLRLTQTHSGYICCADWSPDGLKIAFGRCDDTRGGIFVIPALGGVERKVTDLECGYQAAIFSSWTADGNSLVATDRCSPDAQLGIVVLSLKTGEKRCLDSPPPQESDWGPVLSPDQKTVAFVRRRLVVAEDIYTVALEGGNLRRLTIDDEFTRRDLMWASDGQSIIFHSARSGLDRLWRVPAAGGTIERETVYPNTGTLSRDGRRLAYIESIANSPATVWRLELSSAGGQVVSQREILATSGWNSAAQLSPDGRQIVFESDRSGPNEIWKSNADGSDPQQMTTFGGYVGTPRWSPDGRWIAFDVSAPKPPGKIYVMDSDGRNQHSIVSGGYDNFVPSWSRDGASVYFASNRSGNWQVWRRELASGRETQITRRGGWSAFESYDAKTLYYSHYEGGGIWSMPVGGGEERHITEGLHRLYGGHFAVTDAGLYLLDTEADPGPTIMYFNFETRQLKRVFTLKAWATAENASLASSRDGRTLFFDQEPFPQSSITMVDNFQ